jgi:hypothetical protein
MASAQNFDAGTFAGNPMPSYLDTRMAVMAARFSARGTEGRRARGDPDRVRPSAAYGHFHRDIARRAGISQPYLIGSLRVASEASGLQRA